jgi:hypothetical protein
MSIEPILDVCILDCRQLGAGGHDHFLAELVV